MDVGFVQTHFRTELEDILSNDSKGLQYNSRSHDYLMSASKPAYIGQLRIPHGDDCVSSAGSKVFHLQGLMIPGMCIE